MENDATDPVRRAMDGATNGPGPDQPLLLRTEQVVKKLGLSRSTVAVLLATGELESIKIGRSRRIPVDALHRFIAERLG